jgi:putative tRNA adenosine deaminase-associated protein
MVRNLPRARHDERVSYFTAVIAGNGRRWRARDVDIEEAGSLDDLADTLRAVHNWRGPVLAVIEHEDEWFALVRVDGDDDPRVFVSDMAAASRSVYAHLLAPAADIEVDEDDDTPESADEGKDGNGSSAEEDVESSETAGDEPDEAADVEADLASARVDVKVRLWAGEPDLLEDMGVDGRRLRLLAEEQGDDPGTVLAEIGEACGFGELLDALR